MIVAHAPAGQVKRAARRDARRAERGPDRIQRWRPGIESPLGDGHGHAFMHSKPAMGDRNTDIDLSLANRR
jgi:hypothetical protein